MGIGIVCFSRYFLWYCVNSVCLWSGRVDCLFDRWYWWSWYRIVLLNLICWNGVVMLGVFVLVDWCCWGCLDWNRFCRCFCCWRRRIWLFIVGVDLVLKLVVVFGFRWYWRLVGWVGRLVVWFDWDFLIGWYFFGVIVNRRWDWWSWGLFWVLVVWCLFWCEWCVVGWWWFCWGWWCRCWGLWKFGFFRVG